MKYYEVNFNINAPLELSSHATEGTQERTTHHEQLMSDARDLLAALAGEAGFETFEETGTGVKGYVQQSLFSEEALQEAITDFPIEGVTISYDIREAEDRDWNEQWEQEGFEPIIVSDRLVIHDGKHLPTDVFSLHPSPSTLLQIEIDAKLAFGTGTHETTRMICATLLELRDTGRVLDCGTGTGILSICALKLGAATAVGYDIDEWSVDNARHNAVINQVDDRFESLLGDGTILNNVEGTFDLVLANINRNILLHDMPLFRQKMAPGATLILSGFYTTDIPVLTEKAEALGLRLKTQKADHDWACLVFNL